LVREKTFSDSVINSMPGVFYMLDEEGKFAWWNEHLEEVTEYSGDEFRSLRATSLFEGDDVERIAQAMQEAFREGERTTEAELVSKSGRKTPYVFTGLRVRRDGKPYLIGLGIDVTERREAQVAMEKLNKDLHVAVDELERSNRELSDFAHITAHDLKAPLRGIDMLASWLSEDYGQQLDEQGQENLRLMRERVDRMVDLINGILTYSKIGRSDESVEVLDTRALVEGVVENIAPPDHIEVRIEGAFPHITAQRTRLMQVFQNLIGNAIKYIDKPQGLVRISACTRDDAWEFFVADNGPGIEAKHFDRIFQMFQTLSPSDRCDSTGLGLAMVKKIVQLYGGRVWLESELGQGSAFYFALPKTEEAAVGDPQ
jgi:PAS domain S-box-containing protein